MIIRDLKLMKKLFFYHSVKTPKRHEIKEFWKKMWSNEISHKREKWLKEVQYNGEETEYAEIRTDEVTKIIKASQNWKAQGRDRLQNFWWKQFTTVHPLLARQFTNVIQNPNEIPPFLTKGITYLIPKERSDSKSPEKYR
jgi:hypothetical protein